MLQVEIICDFENITVRDFVEETFIITTSINY